MVAQKHWWRKFRRTQVQKMTYELGLSQHWLLLRSDCNCIYICILCLARSLRVESWNVGTLRLYLYFCKAQVRKMTRDSGPLEHRVTRK